MTPLSKTVDSVSMVFPDAVLSLDALASKVSFLDIQRGDWHGVVEYYPKEQGFGLTSGKAVTEGYGMTKPDEWFPDEDACITRLLILIQSGKYTIPGLDLMEAKGAE